MIKRETCEKIWKCYREIETAEKLLADVEKVLALSNENVSKSEESLKERFGYDKKLELSVPNGHHSYRLFGLSYDLAKPIIKAHISNSQSKLKELQEIAGLELKGGAK